jgi:cystathionine beta-synthase
MAAFAAVQLAQELEGQPGAEDAVIVVLLPDSGRGYLTKIFSDEWLGRFGFLESSHSGLTIGEVLHTKKGDIPALVHTHPNETIADAVHILQEYGVSQMPVVRAEPPVMAAEVAGSVSERKLLDALYTGQARLTDSVELHMDESLTTVGSGISVAEAVAALREADALLVQEDGRPVGVLTRQDLLSFVGHD